MLMNLYALSGAHEREAILLGVRARFVGLVASLDLTILEIDFANPAGAEELRLRPPTRPHHRGLDQPPGVARRPRHGQHHRPERGEDPVLGRFRRTGDADRRPDTA